MTARDDYPAIAVHTRYGGTEGQECTDALAEIDRLRRWKAEATQALDEWETVWEAAGRPGPLGGSKAINTREHLGRYQVHLLQAIVDLRQQAADQDYDTAARINARRHGIEQALTYLDPPT